MSRDTAGMSVDFIVGFTIFLLAFIWVISMIPGLLIGLQAFTIDYDAVTYRTGTLLVEDPGEPASWEVADFNQEWDKESVERLGLAVSRDTPNILALDKVNRFFCQSVFVYPDDYHNLTIFGDYPYGFNISLQYLDSSEPLKSIGPVLPEGYGYIRRVVKIKGVNNESVSYATIDGNNPALFSEHYVNGTNTTALHRFAVLFNRTGPDGINSFVRDPAYQIIPGKESFVIRLENLSTTLAYDPETGALSPPGSLWNRTPCFDITLRYGDVQLSDGASQINLNNPVVTIDNDPTMFLTNTPQTVHNNVTIRYGTESDRTGINWEAPQVFIYVTFTLVPNPSADTTTCPCLGADPACTGSGFLNTTFINYHPVNPFDYNYNTTRLVNVTQPQLRDGILEVGVWSGTIAAAGPAAPAPSGPTISTISPVSGPVAGGTTVTITGTGLSGATAVTFGGTPAAIISNTATQIRVTSPAHAAGAATVVVTTPSGTATGGAFTYIPAPTFASINPITGFTTGGTPVTITGTGFTGATAVAFGGTPATGYTVVSPTTISATTPVHAAGFVDVTISTPGGTATGAGAYQYYVPPVPTFTSITPNTGITLGGTVVTITGTGFTGATAVTFDGTAAASYAVDSDTQITATTPPHADGAVAVVITTPGGTATGAYTYTPPPLPVFTSITPNAGPVAGGTTVTITGTGFTGATAVTIGGSAVTSLTVVDDATITANTPANGAGTVDVVITAPGGTVTGTNVYTYVIAPAFTSMTPTAGLSSGGTVVTISGTGFTGTTEVSFGGTDATVYSVDSDTQITATTPAHATGAVSVTITTPGGTATGTGAFTYTPGPPTFTSISPAAGPISGWTTVTITGTSFTGASAVTFGGTAATGFSVTSDTSITASTPAHAAGAVDVVITAPTGTATASGVYTYMDPITITSTVSTGGSYGTLSPSGAVSVPYGGSQTFAVIPDNNRNIVAVTVDGSVVQGPLPDNQVYSYPFTDVIGNHTIDVQFGA